MPGIATAPPRSAPLARPARRSRGIRSTLRSSVRTRIGATVAAFAMLLSVAVVLPQPPTASRAATSLDGQSLRVSASVAAGTVTRDGASATPGMETFIAGGTNHDWAKLVLMFGEWPITDANVTVITRWMRQENYEKSWWQRNNPLNNGLGSGGGSGLGSYDTLVTAAQFAAKNIASGRYPGIVAGLAASAPTAQTEAAIWASPWASSHYANGAHWHYHPVDVVPAPAAAWGR